MLLLLAYFSGEKNKFPMVFVKTRRFLDSTSFWDQTVCLMNAREAELRCCSSRLRPNEYFWDYSVAQHSGQGEMHYQAF